MSTVQQTKMSEGVGSMVAGPGGPPACLNKRSAQAGVLAVVYSTNFSLNSTHPSVTLRPSVRAMPATNTDVRQ